MALSIKLIIVAFLTSFNSQKSVSISISTPMSRNSTKNMFKKNKTNSTGKGQDVIAAANVAVRLSDVVTHSADAVAATNAWTVIVRKS